MVSRIIERIKRVENVISTEEILNDIKENRTLLDRILKRKGNWIGPVIR